MANNVHHNDANSFGRGPQGQAQGAPVPGRPAGGAPGQGYPQYATRPQGMSPYGMRPQGAPGQGDDGKGKGKGRRKMSAGTVVAIVVAAVAVVVAAVLAVGYLADGTGSRDRNMVAGQLEGKTPEEIEAELNRMVDEGMFNISIAALIEFEDGTAPGEMKIENVPGNPYLMQVDITLDDTGELVYRSGILDPNTHIQFAPLDVDLDEGYYNATALFKALDKETEAEVGTAAAQITLHVLG